jgi:hypothetical protein
MISVLGSASGTGKANNRSSINVSLTLPSPLGLGRKMTGAGFFFLDRLVLKFNLIF